MKITHKINMDLVNRGIIPRIHAVQGDALTRKLEISLECGGSPWQIPGNPSALIRYRLPDRTIGVYDTLPDGAPAWHFHGNVITVAIAPEALALPGEVSLVISLLSGPQVLSTFEVTLEVQSNHSTGEPSKLCGSNISGLLSAPETAEEGQILAVEKVTPGGAALTLKAIDLPPYNDLQSIEQDTEASNAEQTVYRVTLRDGTRHFFTVKNGRDGADGTAGADGADGKSAYDYALEGGYTGTEAEFAGKLASNSGYPVPCVLDYREESDPDDTLSFRRALAENRVVMVPGGEYIISDTLVIRENCCLDLSQDTVLKFTQTAGNCIEMRGSAVLRGNHAILSAAFGLTGNVISMDTSLDGEPHNSIPPYEKSDPMFKRQRFVYDVNIIKTNSSGFNRPAADGKCTGTAIYMHCDGLASIPWMWGIVLSGIRIAGGFSYGIRAYNKDDPDKTADNAWNHDMRIEAVIEACETGVSLENCNGAHLNVTVQPTVSNPAA